MTRERDTIAAPATPMGRSALAVVRVDGPGSVAAVRQLAGGRDLADRRATLVELRDPEGPIDEAVVTVFHGPRSYTGNDLVEISTHGTPAVVSRLLGALGALGVRSAEPGEFTERAVLNGRIDLAQAEGIGELIASRTALQSRLALGNVQGELSRRGEAMRTRLVDVLSRLEASLDFSDEGYDFVTAAETGRILEEIERDLEALVGTFRRSAVAMRGLTAVILGQPNAGKSTLLNFLVGSDRAIVTEEPGTTRDLLRETVELGGLPVTFVDTAGLREATGVEGMGIQRARAAAVEADMILYLIDSSTGRTGVDDQELTSFPGALVVYTKAEVGGTVDDPAAFGLISVHTGRGMEQFLGALDSEVRDRYVPAEESGFLMNERQRDAAEQARSSVKSARELLSTGGEEFLSGELRRASRALELLVGRVCTDELLDQVFSKFCIGK